MTTRREKSKPQKPQINKQLEAAQEPPKPKESGTWKENLGKYLIDISKYVVTGILITSIFKDLDDKFFIYVWSIVVRKETDYGSLFSFSGYWSAMRSVPALLPHAERQALA